MEPEMTAHTKLFVKIEDYYADLVAQLDKASNRISMTYLTFDDGKWDRRIANVLCRKAAEGVSVRLMVDEIGLVTDKPCHLLRNHYLLKDLQSAGVQVDLFRPGGHSLSQLNRLHCKFAAMDKHTAFIGGSNIGDYYLNWSDTNLRLDGQLGSTFHDIYDYLRQFSSGRKMAHFSHLDPSGLWIGDVHIMLTIPGLLADIRRTLLHLIHNADKALYIRTWYFLPDDEILDALCAQAERGVRVNVLLSHRTRVPLIDAANYRHAHRLASSGGHVYRYTGQYMHAKLAWNDRGEVLLGSANLDSRSMNGNFEICACLPDHSLAMELRLAYEADLASSFRQSPEIYQQRSLPGKLLTLSCNLISPWL
jgi:cardiolipin synthase